MRDSGNLVFAAAVDVGHHDSSGQARSAEASVPRWGRGSANAADDVAAEQALALAYLEDLPAASGRHWQPALACSWWSEFGRQLLNRQDRSRDVAGSIFW